MGDGSLQGATRQECKRMASRASSDTRFHCRASKGLNHGLRSRVALLGFDNLKSPLGGREATNARTHARTCTDRYRHKCTWTRWAWHSHLSLFLAWLRRVLIRLEHLLGLVQGCLCIHPLPAPTTATSAKCSADSTCCSNRFGIEGNGDLGGRCRHLSAVSSVMLPPARSSSMACTVSSYSRRAADNSIRRCAWVMCSCMADDFDQQ